uniref:Beta-lactamase-related domain-containing protein n=1 Tax=Paramoeba aestuarina TaxID=180227 RepID=A0A7S4ULP0_9EUKA|mmetsp:Transcript_39012/g.61767  ORF Transcript_39012/g.61767 Transcript_39012/m.61767 type:complete len:183 (+) Transcript_39012:348-896(+)
MHKGERVVDIVFGWEDRSFKEKYSNDTIQIIFSSTKVVESIAMAMLVDRGLISYNDKISKYWPEFAQAGKQDVSLGDLMSHAGGVAGNFPRLLTSDDIKNDRDGKESPLAEILAETPVNYPFLLFYCPLSLLNFSPSLMRHASAKREPKDITPFLEAFLLVKLCAEWTPRNVLWTNLLGRRL